MTSDLAEDVAECLARRADIKRGTIRLEVKSGYHAADLLAAEKIEAWLNTVGLDTAAELLPLDAETPAKAGPTQLSFPYANAA